MRFHRLLSGSVSRCYVRRQGNEIQPSSPCSCSRSGEVTSTLGRGYRSNE